MPSAAVYDCEGPHLTKEERAFFHDTDPWGFILFARHCENPEQMHTLCAELRESVGRHAPIMIDQEGGRVARMRTAQFKGWSDHPPMAVFGELWRLNPEAAKKAAWLNAYLLGAMLADTGVNIDCIPMLDIRQLDSDPVTLGNRAFAAHTDIVTPLGQATIDGLAASQVLPVIKHIPGLGRAQCDSHVELPTVNASRYDLETVDFVPFQALKEAPMGMTAHIVYTALDKTACASYSPIVINDIIRGTLGFEGLLFTDDIKMQALGGDYPTRAEKALKAGCDIALACNFTLAEKQAIAAKVPSLEGKSNQRAIRALAWKSSSPRPQVEPTFSALQTMLKPVWSTNS